MLMKLTTEVNFINFLRAAFTSADLKSIKIQLNCQYLFPLFGSASVKAFSKTLTKLTFDYNFYALKIRSVIEIVTNIVNQHLV
jgi:hypothetical protein